MTLPVTPAQIFKNHFILSFFLLAILSLCFLNLKCQGRGREEGIFRGLILGGEFFVKVIVFGGISLGNLLRGEFSGGNVFREKGKSSQGIAYGESFPGGFSGRGRDN